MLQLKRIEVNVLKYRQNAFTLMELLISLSLGLIILFSMSHFFSKSLVSDKQQKELIFLQQETHQFLNYIQQHILHLGYQGTNRKNSNFSLFEKENKRYFLDKYCLIFFYDINRDGCLGDRKTEKDFCLANKINQTKKITKEVFGFKLEHNEILYFSDDNLAKCFGKQCNNLLESCQNNPDKWEIVLEKKVIKIDKLDFSWYQEPNIIKIEISVTSNKYKHISYQSTVYAYILNG